MVFDIMVVMIYYITTMRTILSVLDKLLNYYPVYGFWNGTKALLFSVGWQQDVRFTNNGYDLITDRNCGYFTGTYFQKIHNFGNKKLKML
jgi:hypothetical protein